MPAHGLVHNAHVIQQPQLLPPTQVRDDRAYGSYASADKHLSILDSSSENDTYDSSSRMATLKCKSPNELNVFRLRAGHCRLISHSPRVLFTVSPICEHYNTPETVRGSLVEQWLNTPFTRCYIFSKWEALPRICEFIVPCWEQVQRRSWFTFSWGTSVPIVCGFHYNIFHID